MIQYTRYRLARVMCFVLAFLALFGCQRKSIPVIDSPPEESRMLLPELPGDSLYIPLMAPELVYDFYKTVSFLPQWSNRPELQDSLIDVLRDARSYGLVPADYAVQQLDDSMILPLRKEVLLTDAFLAFGHDLRYGRKEAVKSQREDTSRFYTLRKALLDGGIRASLETLEPPFAGYRHLRSVWSQQQDTVAESSPQRQIVEVNLGRWRSEKEPWPRRYVLVQVPSFLLYLVDGDSVILTSRVIVGEPETPTPELTSTITRVVTYPYWHVPRKIAVKEYLPAIQRDLAVLDQNNFEVLDRNGSVLRADSVPWASYGTDNFPVTLRQREGRENALGVLKFEFKNPYAVFLHDTNARRLFRESRRAFSHGCIRMEKAEAMAHYLLTGSLKRESESLALFLSKKQKHVIKLPSAIPIYVRYFTAEARDGELRLYEDLYGKDRNK